jgi:PIN domain nuclease of toxin-antitoxin system
MGSHEVIVLDTHAALWLLNDDPALGKKARASVIAARAADELGISAISFWETALLMTKGRLRLEFPLGEMRRKILETGMIELPVSGDIAVLAVDLQNLHGDPADRFIAATAIAHEATLMTADNRLLKWRHKLKRQNASK